MSHAPLPWFAHILNYLATGKILPHCSKQEKVRFFSQVRQYYWEDPYLFKRCPYQVVCRCVCESEILIILTFCYSYAFGGHFRGHRTATKVLRSGFFWTTLFRDAHRFYLVCKCCQRMGAPSCHDMMPLSPILIVEIFDVWGIHFIGGSLGC